MLADNPVNPSALLTFGHSGTKNHGKIMDRCNDEKQVSKYSIVGFNVPLDTL